MKKHFVIKIIMHSLPDYMGPVPFNSQLVFLFGESVEKILPDWTSKIENWRPELTLDFAFDININILSEDGSREFLRKEDERFTLVHDVINTKWKKLNK